jgi:mannosyltransferase
MAARRDDRSTLLWVGAASVLAVLLSGAFLSAKSFWLDEAASVHYADTHRSLVAVATADGGNFALYYTLLHAWLRLGSSDGFVRALSAIFAALAIPPTFLLGRRLFGIRAGIVAAFLLAANPFFIAYAQEARGYTLFALASVISSLLFLRMRERGAWMDVGAYAAASILMIYVHFFGVLVVAAQICTLLAYGRGAASAPRIWSGFAAVALAISPLALLAYRHGIVQIDWIPPLSLAEIGRFFVGVAGGPLGLGAYTISCALAFASVRSVDRGLRASLGTIALWIFVPIAMCAVFSILVIPLFEPRYLIFITPLLAIVAAAGVARLRSRAAILAAFALFAVASAVGLRAYYAAPKEDWRDAAALIAARAQPSDLIVCTPNYAALPLQHALDRQPQHPGLVALAAAPQDAAQNARVWLVVREPTHLSAGVATDLTAQAQALTAMLSRGRRIALERSFFGVEVRLYER